MTPTRFHMPPARVKPRALCCLLLALLVGGLSGADAQTDALCGVVNGIDYPIDISDTTSDGYDDFARYRARFGGLHVGMDIGFRRWGEPVRAAARGRVTYADPEGWDTEKGVVIVEHTFPDSSIAYSLYGHMEESESLKFPPVGACVERGEILGGIGWPSRGLPHLHYEIRNFMPNDGGPGYVSENPQLQGWYHPFDFTELWRARLLPGFLQAVTFEDVADLPPVVLDNGMMVMARDNAVESAYPPNQSLWRVTTGENVIGLAGLPGDRVVAYARSGSAVVLQNGRYAATWTVDGPDVPFVVLGEHLVFLTSGGGLSAFSADGTAQWTIPGDPVQPDRIVMFEGNTSTAAVGLLVDGGYLWRVVDSGGQIVYQTMLERAPVAAPGPDGSWLLLNGATLERIDGGTRRTLGSTGIVHGRAARMTVDLLGNSYIYLDDETSTLLSLGQAGEMRWRIAYPYGGALPPLMDTGSGCMLYTLDIDGMLNVFNTSDGQLVNQVKLYAGGSYTGSPRARLLSVDARERLMVAPGFLSVALLDGNLLTSEVASTCLLG